MMPGGDEDAWKRIKPIVQKVAAQVWLLPFPKWPRAPRLSFGCPPHRGLGCTRVARRRRFGASAAGCLQPRPLQ